MLAFSFLVCIIPKRVVLFFFLQEVNMQLYSTFLPLMKMLKLTLQKNVMPV